MDHPPWLPLEWTAETKVVKKGPSSGTTYKCYTELATGKRFYSKPKVLSYLNLAGQNNGDNSNEQASPESKQLQLELPPTLTEGELDSIAEIYNSAVSGNERFPLASRDEGSSTQQNTTNNPIPRAWETTSMEEDQVEVEQNDQFIIISTSETEDLLEEMLTISNNQSDHDNESKPERAAAAAEEQGEVEETEKPVTNSIESSSSSLRRGSKRLAGAEPELHTLLTDPTPPRKTGRRSARQRSKLYTQSLEVPPMDVDKVEEKPPAESVGQQSNEQNGGVPPPVRFHKEMLSKNYIQYALKVLGCEYEVINEPGWHTAKQFYEEAMSDPFFEYACENVPDPSEILPPLGYYSIMEKELEEFDRDVERCKGLPNFGFPMSFDSDVSVHFETPPEKDYYQLGNGKPEMVSSGDQPKKGK